MISRSTNCGATWSTPIALSTGSRLVQNPQIAVSPIDGAVYVSWRRFKYSTQDDAVMIVKSINGGATFSKPLRVSGVNPVRSGHLRDVRSAAMAFRRWPSMRRAASISHGPIAGTRRCAATLPPATRALSSRRRRPASTWTVPRAIQPAGHRPSADARDVLPWREAAHPLLRPARRRLRVVRARTSTSCRF